MNSYLSSLLRPSLRLWMTTLIAVVASVASARGASVAFQLDPSRSLISLSGTVVALGQSLPLVAQGPGSLTDSYSGTLQVDLQANSLQFVNGSIFTPLEVNAWQPAALGAAGSAPASYGAKATLKVSIFSADAVAASRGLVFLGGSPVLPISDGTFPMSGFVTQFKEGTNAVVDYRVSGAVSLSGSKALGGLLTNRVSTLGSLTNVGGVRTLVLPIKAIYAFSVESTLGPVIYNLSFEGQLVATEASTPPPTATVTFTPLASPGGPLILDFSNELYKLQRSILLNPPAWQDVSSPSPVTIPTSQPGEYFRVVPK